LTIELTPRRSRFYVLPPSKFLNLIRKFAKIILKTLN
jgi:hypothetical protein